MTHPPNAHAPHAHPVHAADHPTTVAHQGGRPDAARAAFVAGLVANLLFLALALLDWYLWDRDYIWAVFIPWAAVILLLILVALLTADTRIHIVREPHAAPAARPVPAASRAEPLVSFAEDAFPFVYNGYTLYSRAVELKNGGQRTIWFFSKRTPASGEKARKPSGFHVGVNERTGLPFLKKGRGADGEDLTPVVAPTARPQCMALTEDGKQCRNSARGESRYCSSHFGYQPPTQKGLAKRIEGDSWDPRDKLSDKASVRGADTRPMRRKAADTKVAVRKRPAS